ncbi:PQQ-binding-like beta-propeller repeat protein [Cryptosporangium aurantiacum]|nr:PQQ-binding-like beta-propeller repeat protein [Cryptosporangium aurantiacum]
MLLLSGDAASRLRFGPAVLVAVVEGSENPGVLIGRSFAYVDESGVVAVDAVTGERRWTVRESDLRAGGPVNFADLVLGAPGTAPTVYAAAFVLLPGPQRRDAVHLLALDPATGARRWSTRVDVPPGSTGHAVTLVGVDDDTLVFRQNRADGPITYAVDTRNHRLRWAVRGVEAMLVDGPVVLAKIDAPEGRSQVVGLRTSDGTRLWSDGPQGHSLQVESLGNGLIYVHGDWFDEDYFVSFLRAATGASVRSMDIDDRLDQCVFDQRETIVCATHDETAPEYALAVGYDVETFQARWRATGTRAPLITMAWNGALYGTREKRSVVLDGRSGQIVDVLGFEPVLMNRYAAVADDPDHPRVLLHPVIGRGRDAGN